MIVKELKEVLSVLRDDTEVYLELQEGNRNKMGRTTCLNTIEIEEGFLGVTLKGVFSKAEEGQ